MKTIPIWTTRCTPEDKRLWTSEALTAMLDEIAELRAALATADQVRADILEEAARVADEYHIRNNSSHLADDIAMSIRDLKAVK